MTARDQAHPGERRLAERDRARGRPPVAAAAARSVPGLGEMLLDARERKGVDLYRAERDTKIRARFLAALERSDFRELPGAVYTKGFLRNYALYLGLDPEAVLAQWKSEVGDVRRQEPTIIVPRPLEAPRPGLPFTRGRVVPAVLTLAGVAFAGYIALQLLRFSQPPELTVDQSAVSEVNAETALLSGTSDAGMTVSILAVGRETYRLTVPADGRWERVVPLKKGRNDFTVTATDPATGKDSLPVRLIVTVPIPQGPEAPTLGVSSPNDEAAFTNGAIPVQGTTNGISIVVSATYLGPAGTIPSGHPTPQPPPMPEPVEMAVDPDTGAFSDAYQLAPAPPTRRPPSGAPSRSSSPASSSSSRSRARRPGSRYGSTTSSSPATRPVAPCAQARHSSSPARRAWRSGPATPAPRSSRSTGRRSGHSASRASRRPGASRRPPCPRRPGARTEARLGRRPRHPGAARRAAPGRGSGAQAHARHRRVLHPRPGRAAP